MAQGGSEDESPREREYQTLPNHPLRPPHRLHRHLRRNPGHPFRDSYNVPGIPYPASATPSLATSSIGFAYLPTSPDETVERHNQRGGIK
jgi:hypothetical protein